MNRWADFEMGFVLGIAFCYLVNEWMPYACRAWDAITLFWYHEGLMREGVWCYDCQAPSFCCACGPLV